MSNNLDNKSIYEIFRACRLCGAGGGYKMPIIPSVVGFDCPEIELRQKIRECVQIEVNQDDKMPPLICEMCVDKVNDFYEFLSMCRDTNSKTRQRLGLPEINIQNYSDGDDCILGVTEPVYVQDEDDEPLSRRSTRAPKVKNERKEEKRSEKKKDTDRVRSLKKELENLIKQETNVPRESRSSRGERHLDSTSSSRSSRSRRSPSPARETRQSAQDKDTPLNKFKDQQKSILKKEKQEVITIDSDEDKDDSFASTMSKRSRDRTDKATDKTTDTPHKKLKLTIKLPPRAPTPPKKSRPGPKCSKQSTPPITPTPKSNETRRPGPKCSKEASPPPTRSKDTHRPGPKSSKEASPPPTRSKDTYRPGPKSKTNAGPKSSKRGSSPVPAQKRRQLSPSPTPKSKRSLSPPKSKLSTPSGPKSKRNVSPPPKSKRVSSPARSRELSPPPEHVCGICESVFHTSQGYSSHVRTHTVNYTSKNLACNPCGEWFTTVEETTSHHKTHKNRNKPYICRGCRAHYRTLADYNQHIAETSCVPWSEVADVKCDECWKEFPTGVLRDSHRCGGKDARPGGKCKRCNKTYLTLKNLKKHESVCSINKKVPATSEVKIEASVRGKLLPMKVRIARCDKLIKCNKRKRYDVSNIAHDFGLDRSCVYPYRLVRVKQEPLSFDGMVSINKDIRDEFYTEEDYVHWDSDNSSSDDEYTLVTTKKRKKVPNLTTLSLKTIFSRRCLGKVPRKLRKVRSDKFDSFFNPEAEFDVQDDINNIINNLGDDNDENVAFSMDNIKVNDVKSISEMVADNETNYESDSLLESNREVVSEDKVDFDLKTVGNIEQNSVNDINLLNNGSETDASLEDKETHAQNNEEKDTASENSQDTDIETSNSNNVQNGNGVESTDIVEKNGVTENPTDLIDEINSLYDKKLMDELDAQISGKDANMLDKNDKILLDDLVPNKSDGKLGMDAIPDEEFHFDTM